jgi:drug/metabolite transporter (DMT)-like permease
MVYSAAAVVLLAWMALAGYSLVGLPPTVYVLLIGLAVGPQLLGHTSFNWALKYLSATFITVAILGEPVGSAILAALLLRQPVQPLQLVGGVLLLLGIATATLVEHRAKTQQKNVAALQLEAGGG